MAEQLKCPNCGGNIDRTRMICPYCGTQFKKDPETIHIARWEPQTEVLKGRFIIDAYMLHTLGAEKSTEIAVRELSKSMAEHLAQMMEIRTEYDPHTNEYKAEAQVRVLRPDYRF